MDVLDRIFANSQDSHFLWVEDHSAILFWQGIVLTFFVFLGNYEFERNTVKPWEIKNLPWDHKKGSETVRVERSDIMLQEALQVRKISSL